MNASDLIHIRDIIDDMEPNFRYVENVNLCVERLAAYMEYIVFDRNMEHGT